MKTKVKLGKPPKEKLKMTVDETIFKFRFWECNGKQHAEITVASHLNGLSLDKKEVRQIAKWFDQLAKAMK